MNIRFSNADNEYLDQKKILRNIKYKTSDAELLDSFYEPLKKQWEAINKIISNLMDTLEIIKGW